MKETFILQYFKGKSKKLLGPIAEILDTYSAQGFDLSVRQLFYQLVARNIVPNTMKMYKSLVGLVNDARYAGLLDWGDIVDRGRRALRPQSWENVGELCKEMRDIFQIDKWKNQPCYCEVMVEKQALEGVLVPVCSELDVTFTANKGYSSASAMYRAGKRFRRRIEEGKDCYVFYLGDHDPSGVDMTDDVFKRVPLLAGPSFEDGGPRPADITVKRLALNMDQIKELNPPENPARITDPRADKYIRQFGNSSWELDAVEPAALANMVRNAIKQLIDQEAWDQDTKKEDAMKKELDKIVKKYNKKKK